MAVDRKIVFLSSFLSVLREGVSGNAQGTHPSRPAGSGPGLSSADHPEHETVQQGCHPKRDGRTGVEVRSKEDVHDQRAPVGVGVGSSA